MEKIAKKAIKTFRKFYVNWTNHFPDELKGKANNDLIRAKIGIFEHVSPLPRLPNQKL